MKKSKQNLGFTLIELLVVIAIIGLLAAIVLASLGGVRERAQITRMVSDLEQIELAMTMWMDATGQVQWPDESDLGVGSNPSITTVANETTLGDYLTTIPESPIGSHYFYDNDGDTHSGCTSAAGVNIGIYVVGSSDANNLDFIEAVDEIVDGEVDLSCGEFTRHSADNLFYSLSMNGVL